MAGPAKIMDANRGPVRAKTIVAVMGFGTVTSTAADPPAPPPAGATVTRPAGIRIPRQRLPLLPRLLTSSAGGPAATRSKTNPPTLPRQVAGRPWGEEVA